MTTTGGPSPANVVAVIPARWGSTRFPGKVLAPLNGKPMIQHVWERVRQVDALRRVLVATDDERVATAVQEFGGEAVMTLATLPSGTDRVAQAVQQIEAQVVVNVQGDEPLVEPAMVASLVDLMTAHPQISMATLKHRLTDPREVASPHLVKVVTDSTGWALYFSRAPIPYARHPGAGPGWFKHLGLYAYQRAFLEELVAWPPSPLELAEGLEQLRALDHGARIMVLETPHDTVGVDTPDDASRVAALLRSCARA